MELYLCLSAYCFRIPRHILTGNLLAIISESIRLAIKVPMKLVSRFRASQQRKGVLYVFQDLFGSDGVI
jgi:hypothetical protein